MTCVERARLVGINHVALEVGDIEEALAFYGSVFELTLRGRSGGMAFVDMGDQFVALSQGRTQEADTNRHFGLVVDDKEAVRRALEATAAEILPGRGLDFRDPWGNLVQIVQYDECSSRRRRPCWRRWVSSSGRASAPSPSCGRRGSNRAEPERRASGGSAQGGTAGSHDATPSPDEIRGAQDDLLVGAAADGERHPIALGSEHSGLRADLVHAPALLGAELGEQVDDLSPGGFRSSPMVRETVEVKHGWASSSNLYARRSRRVRSLARVDMRYAT